jgi:hypothetical protein
MFIVTIAVCKESHSIDLVNMRQINLSQNHEKEQYLTATGNITKV